MGKARDVPHPSVFIAEELAARGWTKDMLAMRMGPEFGIWRLSLDLYFEVGPTDPNLRIGRQSATALGRAFGVSPDFFLSLERIWLAAQSLPSAPMPNHPRPREAPNG